MIVQILCFKHSKRSENGTIITQTFERVNQCLSLRLLICPSFLRTWDWWSDAMYDDWWISNMFHFLSKTRHKTDSNAFIEICLIIMIYSEKLRLVLKTETSESLTHLRVFFISYFSCDFEGSDLDSKSALFCIWL